jgi:hypothetical protein
MKQAIQQRNLTRQANELALYKASADRESDLAVFEASF